MNKIIILIIVFILSIQNAAAIGISSDNLKHDKKFDIADNTNIKVMDAPDGSGGYLFYSTGAHVKKQKVIVAKNKIKKLATFTYGWHKDDAGNIKTIIIPVSDKGGNYEFDIELSSYCVGCYTGTYLQTFTALNSISESTFSQTLTNVSSLTANVTDYAMLSDPYAINTSGLVGWWHLDETTGTLVEDFSGQGNNGTWNGNSTLNTTTGKYNNSLAFDGVNDYVNVTPFNFMTLTSNYSISVWIKWNNRSSTPTTPIWIFQQSLDTTNRTGISIYPATGKLIVGFRNGTSQYRTTSNNLIPNNTWVFVSFMHYSGYNQLYVNNVLQTAGAGSISFSPPSVANAVIAGRSDIAASTFFSGSIDEVRIYNRSLSASEISALYYTHLQELKVTATGNGTPSDYWNGTNPLSIPVASSNTITGLTYTVPTSVTINGIVVNDYRNSTKWDLTATAASIENTTTITQDSASGYYNFNGSFLPSKNSSSGWINLTITDPTFIASTYKGSASMTSNNANFSLSYAYPYFNISTGALNNSFTNTYNISIPYNNAPVTAILPETSFRFGQSVIINTSTSDSENALSCYVKVNGIEMNSCTQNDFGTLPAGTYTIYFNVTEAATVSPQSVNITDSVTIIPTYTVSGYVFNSISSGLEGVLVQNGSNVSTTIASGYYSISGLDNGSYNFSYSKDGFITGYLVVVIDGADNTTANMTLYNIATVASVTDLVNVSFASNYINWTWTDPQDLDFSKVMVYLNGAFQSNVSKGIQYFNATDLVPGTYTIGTRTVDIYNNINATTVTHTATTILPPFRFINGTVIDSVTKTGIVGVTVSTNTSLSTTTNATGFYSFNVTAGTFNLTAILNPTYYTNSSVIVSTNLNAVTVQDIELVKKPTGTITGNVTNI